MKIYHNQWEVLQSFRSVHNDREMKDKLLDEIVQSLQESYYNRSQGVKQAIDMMCFLAKDKGYAFASPKYYMEKFNISKDAIYSIVKALRDKGIVVKGNRSSSKQNGLGGWVLFFKSHPNFKAISSFLNLESKAETKPEQKAENGEMPTESKDEGKENIPTYIPPISTDINNKKNKSPLGEFHLDESFLPSYIPKYFVKLVKPFFSIEDIDTLYSITDKTIHKYNKKLAVEELSSTIEESFKTTIFGVKKGRVKAIFEDIKHYYIGVLRRKIGEISRQLTVNNSPVFYDWVEE